MYERVLEAGMKKLKAEDQNRLASWNWDVKHYEDIGDTENKCEKKGQICGYLNALVNRDEITLEEAIELYHHYTH